MGDPRRVKPHGHTGFNDGGILSSAVVFVGSSGGGGGGSSGTPAAVDVSIADTGANFTATNVEDALAEIASQALDDLSDVNAPAPSDGDLLAWDSTPGEWVNVAPPSGSVPSGTDPGDLLVWDGSAWDILPVGTDDDLLTADAGEALGVRWAAPAGGAFTHAYVGYDTVGGSTENVVTRRQIMKKVTLAADCLVTSIGVYVKQITTGASISLAAGILTDSGGSPALLIAKSTDAGNEGMFLSTANGTAGAARWVSRAMGTWLVAGDYWIAVEFSMLTANAYQVYYDGSGGDRYYTNNADNRMSDSGWTAVTTSSNKYSIRASIIS